MKKGMVLILLALFMINVCAFATEPKCRHEYYPTMGAATWYSEKSCKKEGTSGIWTASGERFDENAMTCAMRRRDFGKYYKVTNLANNKSVIVRHNDYGPNRDLFSKRRIIDLTKGAFVKISCVHEGIIEVTIEEVVTADENRPKSMRND